MTSTDQPEIGNDIEWPMSLQFDFGNASFTTERYLVLTYFQAMLTKWASSLKKGLTQLQSEERTKT